MARVMGADGGVEVSSRLAHSAIEASYARVRFQPGSNAERMPTSIPPSEDQHVARFGAATGEIGRRGEGGVLAIEIGLRDPTGLRATPSDEDRYTLLLNLRH